MSAPSRTCPIQPASWLSRPLPRAQAHVRRSAPRADPRPPRCFCPHRRLSRSSDRAKEGRGQGVVFSVRSPLPSS
jgi:hypothetical protein